MDGLVRRRRRELLEMLLPESWESVARWIYGWESAERERGESLCLINLQLKWKTQLSGRRKKHINLARAKLTCCPCAKLLLIFAHLFCVSSPGGTRSKIFTPSNIFQRASNVCAAIFSLLGTQCFDVVSTRAGGRLLKLRQMLSKLLALSVVLNSWMNEFWDDVFSGRGQKFSALIDINIARLRISPTAICPVRKIIKSDSRKTEEWWQNSVSHLFTTLNVNLQLKKCFLSTGK